MWISKKKHRKEVWEASVKASERQHEWEQEDKLLKLGTEVKKLKKELKKLKHEIREGY